MRFKQPDRKKAVSLVDAAKRELQFTLTLPITDASASTIIRNVHECFKMLGEALLVANGRDSQGHDEMIGELLKLHVKTVRPIQAIDNLRKLRNKINYDGYRPTISEAQNAVSLADACFKPLYEEALKIVSKH